MTFVDLLLLGWVERLSKLAFSEKYDLNSLRGKLKYKIKALTDYHCLLEEWSGKTGGCGGEWAWGSGVGGAHGDGGWGWRERGWGAHTHKKSEQ